MKKYLFSVTFPMWFKIIFTICYLSILRLPVSYVFLIISKGLFIERKVECIAILLSCLIISWFLLKITYYSIEVYDEGLELKHFWITHKKVNWKEIAQIKKPLFIVPVDFIYIVLITNKKLLLIKSMNNYKKLIYLIKERIGVKSALDPLKEVLKSGVKA